MHLQEGEAVLRTVNRHLTPYWIRMIGIAAVAVPLYGLAFWFLSESNSNWPFWILAGLSIFLGIVIATSSLDYLLDKLIITNKRVVWINWKSIFRRAEHEAEFLDIQDIDIVEKGILAKLNIFDYGFLEVETAASKTCIAFEDCPNPEEVKNFILLQVEKKRGGIYEKREARSIEEPIKPVLKISEEEWSVN